MRGDEEGKQRTGVGMRIRQEEGKHESGQGEWGWEVGRERWERGVRRGW